MTNSKQSSALATVTSTNFLPGTVVMLHSFLTHNEWFDGDIVVIQDDLGHRSIEVLEQNFDRVRIVRPSRRLVEKLDVLVEANPQIAGRRARFHSLEATKLEQYDKLLFCDSDLLFRASVQDLFDSDAPLVCCGDAPFLRHRARDAVTFTECSINGTPNELDQCFNSGFMISSKLIRTADNYEALLSMIDVERWKSIETAHTDQLLYNIHFNGQQSIVHSKFNFMMPHRIDIFEKYGIRQDDACVLHFNGPVKPWSHRGILYNFNQDPAMIRALKEWNEVFANFLTQKSVMLVT